MPNKTSAIWILSPETGLRELESARRRNSRYYFKLFNPSSHRFTYFYAFLFQLRDTKVWDILCLLLGFKCNSIDWGETNTKVNPTAKMFETRKTKVTDLRLLYDYLASFLKQSKRAEKRNQCRTEFLLTTVSLDSPNPTLCFTANRWYASLGCWKDTESFAVSPLEGADPLLTEPYLTRQKPIDTCAQVARKHDYKGKLLPFSSSWSGGGGLN